jgi:hypothetical protein
MPVPFRSNSAWSRAFRFPRDHGTRGPVSFEFYHPTLRGAGSPASAFHG